MRAGRFGGAMPSSARNVRFQLSINNQDCGTAGIEDIGVLTVTIDWVKRDLAKAPEEARKHPKFTSQGWICDSTSIHLGGIDSKTDEHIEWFNGQLQAGDEIIIRVLPGGEFDPPKRRYCAREGG
jgi:hypothetical protein